MTYTELLIVIKALFHGNKSFLENNEKLQKLNAADPELRLLLNKLFIKIHQWG